MDLRSLLDQAAQSRRPAAEKPLYLNEYIELIERHPSITHTAHARMFSMIDQAGTLAGKYEDEISYQFFADNLYGMDGTLERVVRYFESAAQGHETKRRILLLWGPPGGAKSTIVAMIKRGLEVYSTTDEGAIYAIEGCPMQENPLHLVDDVRFRQEIERSTGAQVEGELCPVCQWRLEHEWDGNILKVPLVRVRVSEARRQGIATFEPGDPKSMSMEQLTGGLDFKKIEQYGSDAHPMSLDWAGEFSKGNRGLFEAVEFLKLPPDFRLAFLSIAQEKQFKIPKFGYVSSDMAVVAHSNESEFRAFMADPKNEALRDRLYTIPVPYNVRLDDERKIYKKLLSVPGSDETRFHIAPHSLEAASMVAVLSRLLEHPNLGTLDKLKLYNGEEVGDWKIAQIPEIKRAADGEGLNGLGPRRIIDILSSAAVAQGKGGNEPYLTPVIVLRALNQYIENLEVSRDERDRLKAYVLDARKEVDRRLKDEVRKAFIPAFSEQAQQLLENYLTNVEAYCQNTKLRDSITEEELEPDEKLMRAVEEKVTPTVPENAKDSFRQGVLMRIGIALRHNDRPLSYNTDTRLGSGIEEHLFDEMKDIVRVTVSKTNPDKEQAKRLNEVLRVLVEDRHYTEASAKELLEYVGSLLNR